MTLKLSQTKKTYNLKNGKKSWMEVTPPKPQKARQKNGTTN